jgi:hypothetical protein
MGIRGKNIYTTDIPVDMNIAEILRKIWKHLNNIYKI